MGLRLAYRAATLAGSVLCLSSLVHAQGPTPAPSSGSAAPSGAPPTHGPVALHWVRMPGAEGCVAGDALAREVEQKLGRPVFPVPRDAEVLIEGHVRHDAQGYHAELRMLGAGGNQIGSRALSSPLADCRELSETLSVVLAVMIDPEAEGHTRPAPEPAAPKPEPAKPPAAPAPAPAPSGYPDANRLLSFARVLFAVVPETAYGIGAAYERALGAAGGLRLELISYFSQRVGNGVEGSPDATLDLRLTHAGLAYCPLWLGYDRVRLAGCAGVELGAMRAESFYLDQDDPSTDFWMSGSAALRFSARLVAALELHLGASFVATNAHKYEVSVLNPDGSTARTATLDEGSSFGAALDLGLGARF